MEPAFNIITNAKELTKAIDTAKVAGQSYQATLHTLAVSVLNHVARHKDVRMVKYFIASQVEATRVNAIKAWFENFGPVVFDKDEIKYVAKKVTLSKAIALPFWKFKPEEAYQPLNVQKAIADLIKRIEHDEKKTGTKHSAEIIGLRALATKQAPVALAA